MAKSTPSIIASLLLLCLAGTAFGQTTTVRGAAKGTSTPQPVTSTASDANHTGLDVNIVGGGGSGGTSSSFGAAFPATGTAIGLSDGVNMVPGLADGSGNFKINCAVGCSGSSFADNAAFTFGTTAIGLTGFVVDDVATNAVTENSAGLARMNANRIQYVMPTGSTGTALFPAAFASADNIAAQTATFMHNGLMAWDSGGSNWDRLLTTSGALNVNVQNASLTITDGAGALNVIVDSGTLTANQGGSPWAENVTQFGGVNLSTGTGASGTGIPRVTVANDSNILATQSGTWNIGTLTTLTGITNALPTGSNTIGAVTGTSTDNSANSSLKLPVLAARANASAPTWTEGFQVPLSVDTAGNLRVNSTGGGVVDQSTFTAGVTTESPAGGIFNDSLAALTSGMTGAFRATAQRAEHVNLRDAQGIERGTQAAPIIVQQAVPTKALSFGSGFVDAGTQRVELAINSKARVNVSSAIASAGYSVLNQGQFTTLSTDLSGNLRVTDGSMDGGSFTAGTSVTTEIGGVVNDAMNAMTTGTSGATRMTAQRALHQNLRDSYGNELGTPNNPVSVKIQGLGLLTPTTNPLAIPAGLNLTRNQPTVAFLANQGAFRGYQGAVNGDYGLVVHPSIAPAMQCPFVKNISVTANTQLVTNAGGQSIHVCTFSVVLAAAESVSLVEGTGTTCGTGTTGLYGGTSASTAFAGNGGVAVVSDRIVLPMQVKGDNLCLLKSAASNASGTLTYGVY